MKVRVALILPPRAELRNSKRIDGRKERPEFARVLVRELVDRPQRRGRSSEPRDLGRLRAPAGLPETSGDGVTDPDELARPAAEDLVDLADPAWRHGEQSVPARVPSAPTGSSPSVHGGARPFARTRLIARLERYPRLTVRAW